MYQKKFKKFKKLAVEIQSGEIVDRLSPWATYVTQCKETKLYQMVFNNPPADQVKFTNECFLYYIIENYAFLKKC